VGCWAGGAPRLRRQRSCSWPLILLASWRPEQRSPPAVPERGIRAKRGCLGANVVCPTGRGGRVDAPTHGGGGGRARPSSRRQAAAPPHARTRASIATIRGGYARTPAVWLRARACMPCGRRPTAVQAGAGGAVAHVVGGPQRQRLKRRRSAESALPTCTFAAGRREGGAPQSCRSLVLGSLHSGAYLTQCCLRLSARLAQGAPATAAAAALGKAAAPRWLRACGREHTLPWTNAARLAPICCRSASPCRSSAHVGRPPTQAGAPEERPQPAACAPHHRAGLRRCGQRAGSRGRGRNIASGPAEARGGRRARGGAVGQASAAVRV